MIKRIFLLLIALFFITGCSTGSPTQSQAITAKPQPILKISVLASNHLLLNGQQVTTQQLSSHLQKARHNKTPIWYYRENSTQQPPPITQSVIKMIIHNQLSIRLSSKADFSDYVTADGISKNK